MTEPDGRYGEELRRALSAVVDPLEPAGDGLTKIRARAVHRPPVLAWIIAYVTYLPAALVTWVRIAASWAGVTAADPSALIVRLRSVRHWPRRARGVLRRPDAWLRPALAVAGALALVVIATVLVPRLRNTVEIAIVGNTPGSSANAPDGPPSGPGQAQGASSHRITSAPASSGVWSSGSPAPCVPRSPGGGSAPGPTGTSTPLIPFGPMPGPSQSVPPQMLGVLPPGPPNVAVNSCSPSIGIPVSHLPSSTPTVSQPASTPPTSTPVSTPPSSPPPTSTPPTSTPVSTPPSSPAPAGSTSPTGMASASPIPG